MTVGTGDRLLETSVAWSRELRRAGLGVGLSGSLDFVRALGVMGVGSRDDVRAASRAVHVRRQGDISVHDELFDSFWSSASETGWTETRVRLAPRPSESAAGAEDEADITVRRTYSADEVLRHKEFELMTADELRQAERLIDRLGATLAVRPSRRYELHAHGTRLAPRPMMRRSVQTGGELLDWLWRRRRVVPRPVTLLIDVSGSMDTYARLLLRFAHALARVNKRTDVFVFGTRLTRVTRHLRRRSVDEALLAVSAAVADWSGGTRIGASLHEFNQRWTRRVSPSGAIVVVLSDGWDRGDPEVVAEATARLRRTAYRLLWLNPLAGAPGYQPLAAGMAAALRHVDRLLPAGTLADLEGFADLLADTNWGLRPSTRAPASPSSVSAGDPAGAPTVSRSSGDQPAPTNALSSPIA